MRMNTPSFWYGDAGTPLSGAKAAALSSLSALYGLGHALHQSLARPRRAEIPVLCIGNLVAGGSGKTPASMAVMKMIRERGLAANPCFLTRGYGGRLKGPVIVDPETHTAADVGDESLLLAAIAPAVVCADRYGGAVFARENGYDFIIMDDGLHNTSLKPDCAMIVIDGAAGFGNGLLLPAGPLRAPLHRGLALADAILIIGRDERDSIASVPKGKVILRAEAAFEAPPDRAKSYYAFCGIARPEKFEQALQKCGLPVAGFRAFPDHYAFRDRDFESLKKAAGEARLITTAKDAVRLAPRFIPGRDFDILGLGLVLPQLSQDMLARMIAPFLRHP